MSEPDDINQMSEFNIKEIAQEALKNPEMQQMVKQVLSDPETLNQYKNFFKGGKRKSKKRGGKCEYKKVDGKWKNVCTGTKKNFKIKKTDMLTSKIGYNVRKKKQQKAEKAKPKKQLSSKCLAEKRESDIVYERMMKRKMEECQANNIPTTMPEKEKVARQCSGKYFVGEQGFCNSLDKYGLEDTHFDLNPATCCQTKKGAGKKKRGGKKKRKTRRKKKRRKSRRRKRRKSRRTKRRR